MRPFGFVRAAGAALLLFACLSAAPAFAQLCGTASVNPSWGGPPGTTIRFSAGGWYGGCHADEPYFWLIDGVPYYWYQVVKSFNEPGTHTWSFCTWQAGCSQCCDDGSFVIGGTAGPTPTPGPDLIADSLEVTQGIQDTANNVRLVAGKQTFVRFHVRSRSGRHSTTARLRVTSGSSTRVVYPVNPGAEIRVREVPLRNFNTDAFLFAFPTGFAAGSVTLRAEVNPGDTPVETDRSNNEISTSVRFESVPALDLAVYAVRYSVGANAFETSDLHVFKLLFWLQNAYPVSRIQLTRRTYDAGVGVPDAEALNRGLLARSMLDLVHGSANANTRHLGLVDDGGKRPTIGGGMAVGIPGAVATAFTGVPTGPYRWDRDGSYGDWLAGHELGHTLARSHAEFCGAIAANADGSYPPGYVAYPYANGKLSPPQGGTDQYLGFDIFTRRIIDPPRYELMTYCYNLGGATWISDFTYEGILDRLLLEGGGAAADLPQSIADRLLVVGSIDADGSRIDLEPLLFLPDSPDVAPATGGDHAVVLRNAAGGELARYAVTTQETHVDTVEGSRTVNYLTTLVPYVAGTERVDIEGPAGVLQSITAGPNPPSVSLTTPTTGTVLTDGTTLVSWTAADSDGDSLRFTVLFSPDDGSTWRTVAQNLSAASVALDPRDLTATASGRLRVIASDGIHSAQSEVAGLTMPNRVPSLELLEPSAGMTLVAAQGVTLRALAYDTDRGVLDDAIEWSSDRSGRLGSGANLHLPGLTIGRHVLTARVDDGAGGVSVVSTNLTVVSTPLELPPVSDALFLSPEGLSLTADDDRAVLHLDNIGPSPTLTWQLATDAAWLELSSRQGETPTDVEVRYRGSGLAPGSHTAIVQATSSDLPGIAYSVPVSLWLAGSTLPCTGDCDGDGTVTVDELIKGVTIALGTASLSTCSTFDGNADGSVTVDEIVAAVIHALGGCPVTPGTPTVAPTHTHTRTATAAATQGTASPTAPRPSNTPTRTPTAAVTLLPTGTATRTSTAIAPTRTATATATQGVAVYCSYLEEPLPIPDADELGVFDAITISGAGTVDELRLSLDIGHTWVGDVVVRLTHLDSLSTVTLIDRPGIPATSTGCGGDDIVCELSDEAAIAAEATCSDAPALGGSLRPLEPLANLRSLPRAGLWVLELADLASLDTGELRGWCLRFGGG